MEFKASIISSTFVKAANKYAITSLSPVSWIPGCESKEEINAIARHAIIFDFDGDEDTGETANIPQIIDILTPYLNIAWSSYNDKVKGPRLRVFVPIKQVIDKPTWIANYKYRLPQWLASIGLSGGNKADKSCYNTFAQVGAAPSINPAVGTIDFNINDHATAEVLDLDKVLAGFSNPVPATATKTYVSIDDYIANTEQKTAIIQFLRQNNDLLCISREERMDMARAFRSIGMDRIDFSQLDNHMAMMDTGTDTDKVWTASEKTRGTPHPGKIIKHLTFEQRRICGFASVLPTVEEYEEEIASSKWDIEINLKKGQYLDRSVYGAEKKVLLCAAMGSGKNESINKHINTPGDRVICFAPLKTIVSQANGLTEEGYKVEESFDDLNVKTFVYDKARALYDLIDANEIDPSTITLVVDECHNLKTIVYRQDAHFWVSELLKLPFKQIVLQSATIGPDDLDGIFCADKKVKVSRIDAAPRYYSHVEHDESVSRLDATIATIIDGYKAGQKVLVLWNDNAKIAEIKSFLDHSGLLHSAIVNRHTTRFLGCDANQMAQDGDYVMGDIDCFLGTYSMVEGVNIKDKVDSARVIVVGNEHPQYITQLCGRMRLAREIECFHVYRQKDEVKSTPEEYVANKLKSIASTAKILMAYEDNTKSFDASDNHIIGATFSNKRNAGAYTFSQSLYYDKVAGCYHKSSAARLFLEAEGEKRLMYSSSELAAAVLKTYGFRIRADVQSTGISEDMQELLGRSIASTNRTKARFYEREFQVYCEAIDDCGSTSLSNIKKLMSARGDLAGSTLVNSIHAEFDAIINEFQGSLRDQAALKKYLRAAITKKNIVFEVAYDNAEDHVGDSMNVQARKISEDIAEVNDKTGKKYLTIANQQVVIQRAIKWQMDKLIEADKTLDVFEVYKLAVSGERFKNYRVKDGGISFSCGCVIISVARPSKLIKALGINGSAKQMRDESGEKVGIFELE